GDRETRVEGAAMIAVARRTSGLLALAVVLGLPPRALAQTLPGSAETRDPTWELASGAALTLFPAGEVFPPYVPDPHRPVNAILFRFYSGTELAGTTAQRTTLSGGGRLRKVRIATAARRARARVTTPH